MNVVNDHRQRPYLVPFDYRKFLNRPTGRVSNISRRAGFQKSAQEVSLLSERLYEYTALVCLLSGYRCLHASHQFAVYVRMY